MERRSVDVIVLSDVHLGTYGCRAKELLTYLTTGNYLAIRLFHRRNRFSPHGKGRSLPGEDWSRIFGISVQVVRSPQSAKEKIIFETPCDIEMRFTR